jgi:hypothetical protein
LSFNLRFDILFRRPATLDYQLLEKLKHCVRLENARTLMTVALSLSEQDAVHTLDQGKPTLAATNREEETP